MKKLIIILTLALSACATAGGRKIDWDVARSVQPGMTETQLVERMGDPYRVSARADRQVWVYVYVNTFTGASESTTFIVKDHHVEAVPPIPASFH